MVPLLVAQLIKSGISILGGALLDKGKEAVEKKLGIELPPLDEPVSDYQLAELRQIEMEHERALLELSIKAREIEIDAEKAADANVTERWRTDMTSDSWMSKNMRPLVLAYLTIAITIMAFASRWLDVSTPWIDLLGTAYVTVIAAYFGSRGVEKVMAGRKL